jgi:ribonuclease G
LDYLLSKQNESGITLIVHPYLHSFFTAGIFSKRVHWLLKYFKWIRIEKDSSLALTEYKFTNKQADIEL